MLHRLKLLSVMLLCSLALLPTPSVSAHPRDDRPLFTRFIGPHSLGFLHIRTGDLLRADVVKAVLEKLPDVRGQLSSILKDGFFFPLEDIDSISMMIDMPTIVNGEPRDSRPPYVVIRSSKPMNFDAIKADWGKNSRTIMIGKYEMVAAKNRGIARLDDHHLFLALDVYNHHSEDDIKNRWLLHFAMLETPQEVPEGLKGSVNLAMTSKHQAVGGFALSKELSEAMEPFLQRIPPTMAPFKALGKVRSATVMLNYDASAENDLQLKLLAQFPDNSAAKAGMGAMKFGIAAGKIAINSVPRNTNKDVIEMTGFMSKQLDLFKVDTVDSQLIVNYGTNTKAILPALLTTAERVRYAAQRTISSSNMRQQMIAMHNYHNDYNRLPPMCTVKNGKPLHSWRVLMLPYLELDNIYKQLKIDEPWDSAHNLKIFESMPTPSVYLHPEKRDAASRMTYYKVFYSKPGNKPGAVFGMDSKLTLGQLTVQDGTSNTIGIIEAGPPVLWYKPEDIEFDHDAPLPKLISPWKNNLVEVSFMDASIRSFSLDGNPEIWRALITRNGGEAVDIATFEK